MTNNRLEEIRARNRESLASTGSISLYTHPSAVRDIEYLLSLLDARPTVAADARELATEIMNQIAVGAWQFCSREWNIENCAQRITAYVNQRGEQQWREGVEAASAVARQWADSHSCDAHDDNPCCHVRTGAAIAEAISTITPKEK